MFKELHFFHVFSVSRQEDYTDASISSSPILESALTTEDPTFVTAQGSSFFIKEGQSDTCSLSYNTDCQSKEDLAGSYHYSALEGTPPEVQSQPAERASPNGGYLYMCEEVWENSVKMLKTAFQITKSHH